MLSTYQILYFPSGSTNASRVMGQPLLPCSSPYVLPSDSNPMAGCSHGQTGIASGTICTAVCHSGFTSIGSQTCTDGLWLGVQVCNPIPPRCQSVNRSHVVPGSMNTNEVN